MMIARSDADANDDDILFFRLPPPLLSVYCTSLSLVHMPQVFWDTVSEQQGLMARSVARMDIMRQLFDDNHRGMIVANKTQLIMMREILLDQAKEHKAELFLVANKSGHIIYSINPGSKLVGKHNDE